MNESNVAEYVYIVGHGHSGTTLLELLLARHPRIVATGELEKMSLQFARDESAPYLGLCSCGKRPKECFFWTQVADAIMEKYGIDFAIDPWRFRVSDIGREEDYGIRSIHHRLLYKYYRFWRILAYERRSSFGSVMSCLSIFPKRWAMNRLFVVDRIRQITGSTTVIDSSKDPVSMIDLYRLRQGSMKVVFITRDVRGNVGSKVKRGASVSTGAKAWCTVNSRIRKCLRHLNPSDWIHVRYEELCDAPATIVARVWAFLGYDDAINAQETVHRAWHTIGGNKIRYSDLDKIVEDMSWRQRLSTNDLGVIRAIAEEEIALLGYEWDRSVASESFPNDR